MLERKGNNLVFLTEIRKRNPKNRPEYQDYSLTFRQNNETKYSHNFTPKLKASLAYILIKGNR